jgi:hypothetical protein
MRDIVGFEKARQVIGEFRFSEFPIIRELRFYEDEQQKQCIDLVIESDGREPNYRMKLTFVEISGLRVDNFGGGQTRIIGLDVVNVAERQWERVCWEVVDFENNALEFRANSAEIVWLLPLPALQL